MKIKKMVWFLFLTGTFAFLFPVNARAKETVAASAQENSLEGFEDEIDYNAVQEAVDGVLDTEGFDFKACVKELLAGGGAKSFNQMCKEVGKHIKAQIFGDKNLIVRFMGIAVMGALFSNFSKVFKNGQVSETGFYVTYLLLFTMLSASFYQMAALGEETIGKLFEFMRVLVPSYYMTVAFSAGAGTSAAFYQTALIVMMLAEWLLLKCILPFIKIYFVLVIANYISEEDFLSKLIKLLESLLKGSMKVLLGAVAGYHVIQGIMVPAADSFKDRTAVKLASAVPGVGDAFGAVADSVLGAAVILKNAVGLAGIIVILLILLYPILRIGVYTLSYRAGAALIQPVSDKRILECMNGASQAASLLLYAVFASGVLFLLMIAVVMASTNGRAWS